MLILNRTKRSIHKRLRYITMQVVNLERAVRQFKIHNDLVKRIDARTKEQNKQLRARVHILEEHMQNQSESNFNVAQTMAQMADAAGLDIEVVPATEEHIHITKKPAPRSHKAKK